MELLKGKLGLMLVGFVLIAVALVLFNNFGAALLPSSALSTEPAGLVQLVQGGQTIPTPLIQPVKVPGGAMSDQDSPPAVFQENVAHEFLVYGVQHLMANAAGNSLGDLEGVLGKVNQMTLSLNWIYDPAEYAQLCNQPQAQSTKDEYPKWPRACTVTDGGTAASVIALYEEGYTYEDYNEKVGEALTNLIYMLLGVEVDYDRLTDLYWDIYEKSTTYELLAK